jgi:hypothetical protein
MSQELVHAQWHAPVTARFDASIVILTQEVRSRQLQLFSQAYDHRFSSVLVSVLQRPTAPQCVLYVQNTLGSDLVARVHGRAEPVELAKCSCGQAFDIRVSLAGQTLQFVEHDV